MTDTPAGLYVQYGCGFSCPEGWRNFDASPQLRAEKLPLVGRFLRRGKGFPPGVLYGDVRRRLPVAAGAARGVYASHVLEHLALADFARAIDETWRILAPGGIFRAVVPDLETYARRYVAALDGTEAATEAAPRFMRESYLGRERRSGGVMGTLRDWIGNSHHLWMWDEASLSAALARRGFTAIRRARFNDCEDPMFARVEAASRFEDACAIEARRPA